MRSFKQFVLNYPPASDAVTSQIDTNDLAQLRHFCTAPENILWNTLVDLFPQAIRESRYLFIPRCHNEAKRVLAVVHTDVSKGDQNISFNLLEHDGRLVINSRALDDRLGLFMLVQLSRYHDFDLLVTTDEEIGASSATDFILQYRDRYRCNWIFSIDRCVKQTLPFQPSVVLYQYHDDDMVKLCETAGFYVEYGSYSDIAVMEDLNVKGFNFSAAYRHEHSDACHAYWDEVNSCLDTINRFLATYSATYLKHEDPYRWSNYWIYNSVTTYKYPTIEIANKSKLNATVFLFDPRSYYGKHNDKYESYLSSRHNQFALDILGLKTNYAALCGHCSNETFLQDLCILSKDFSLCRRCVHRMFTNDDETLMKYGSYLASLMIEDPSGDIIVDGDRVTIRSNYVEEYQWQDGSTMRIWTNVDENDLTMRRAQLTLMLTNGQQRRFSIDTSYDQYLTSHVFLSTREFANSLYDKVRQLSFNRLKTDETRIDYVVSLADVTSVTPSRSALNQIYQAFKLEQTMHHHTNVLHTPVAMWGDSEDFTYLVLRYSRKSDAICVDVYRHIEKRFYTITITHALDKFPYFTRSFIAAYAVVNELFD